jgi:hypothetical protein
MLAVTYKFHVVFITQTKLAIAGFGARQWYCVSEILYLKLAGLIAGDWLAGFIT